MIVQSQERLEATIAAYDLLASLFLTLPDESLVQSLLDGAFEQVMGDEALDEIARYGRAQKDRAVEDVLLDISRDRVRLMRGVNQEGIEPPYESLYIGQQANTTIGSLNAFFREQGYAVGDDVKDAPDQLGVEVSFDKLLLELELDALEKNDLARAAEHEALHRSFLSQHLGRWAPLYAAKMADAAETGFYRGIALLIGELFDA